jgi:hypothetical protein
LNNYQLKNPLDSASRGLCVYLYKFPNSNLSVIIIAYNTDRSAGVFCTHISIGTVGIINEMLLYSDIGEIELLPALPRKWVKGFINGLMSRTNAFSTRNNFLNFLIR